MKRAFILLALGGWILAAPVRALDLAVDWDRVFDVGQQVFERLAPESVREEYEFPSREHWRLFWQDIDRALQSNDLVDLAWLKPEAELALEFLQSVPFLEPYAAWLQQRLDYMDMSHRVLQAHTNTREPLRPTPTPATKPPLRPPTPKPPVAVPPADNRAMQRTARSDVNWERRLAGRPMPARAEVLLPDLQRIFREEGVPPELVWLAEVESSFNPSARSPVGATGLFQFMPSTAEHFGMSLQPQDERLDPLISARAAAQYLRFLHERFQSWPLALAAYNAGQGRVGRVLRQHQGRSFEDIVDFLPSETQMYVPKIRATIKLRAGADLDALPPPGPALTALLEEGALVAFRSR